MSRLWPHSPETWSAIATGLAALAALFSWIQQRDSAIDAIRPEIVVGTWAYPGPHRDFSYLNEIEIRRVSNVGKGSARSVIGFLSKPGCKSGVSRGGETSALMNAKVSFLAPGESRDLRAVAEFDWECAMNPTGNDPTKMVILKLELWYWDMRGNRYKTIYNLSAVTIGGNFSASNLQEEVAPFLYSNTAYQEPPDTWLWLSSERITVRIKQWFGY